MAAKSSVRRRLSARVAAIERHNGPGDPRLRQLHAELATEGLAEVITETIGSAPPLDANQRARLTRIIYTGLANG